jgi:hypothetical protein
LSISSIMSVNFFANIRFFVDFNFKAHFINDVNIIFKFKFLEFIIFCHKLYIGFIK